VRQRHGGDRHDDQIVEQDRPPGHEAPELVEGIAGQRRGTALLGMHRVALDVGHARDDEEQRRRDEDDRRHPERVLLDHAEDEQHRRAERAERHRRERRRAEVRAHADREVRPAGLGDALGEALRSHRSRR
jgi:hypothetical protein